ncbi:hypothetical protein HanPSC8_Chr01g0035481 [Helianthus annuus]|nr:hypothetical protein HanPSC8_Chr01g0035481 [Helianthus annuus]
MSSTLLAYCDGTEFIERIAYQHLGLLGTIDEHPDLPSSVIHHQSTV